MFCVVVFKGENIIEFFLFLFFSVTADGLRWNELSY